VWKFLAGMWLSAALSGGDSAPSGGDNGSSGGGGGCLTGCVDWNPSANSVIKICDRASSAPW